MSHSHRLSIAKGLTSSSFDSFDNWIFYAGTDVNNTGNVLFMSQADATQQKLIFNTDSGTTIIKVDNTTDGRNNSQFGRPSVKLLSQYTISTGNLLLFDAVHMPYGVCKLNALRLAVLCLTSDRVLNTVLSLASILDSRTAMARQRRDRYRGGCQYAEDKSDLVAHFGWL